MSLLVIAVRGLVFIVLLSILIGLSLHSEVDHSATERDAFLSLRPPRGPPTEDSHQQIHTSSSPSSSYIALSRADSSTAAVSSSSLPRCPAAPTPSLRRETVALARRWGIDPALWVPSSDIAIMVVNVDDRELSNAHSIGVETKACYAALHGYAFVYATERLGHTRQPHWTRVLALRKLLGSSKELSAEEQRVGAESSQRLYPWAFSQATPSLLPGKGVRWAFYFDHDTAITNGSIPLQIFIAAALQRDPAASLILNEGDHINTGGFAVRGNVLGLKLLDAWWKAGESGYQQQKDQGALMFTLLRVVGGFAPLSAEAGARRPQYAHPAAYNMSDIVAYLQSLKHPPTCEIAGDRIGISAGAPYVRDARAPPTDGYVYRDGCARGEDSGAEICWNRTLNRLGYPVRQRWIPGTFWYPCPTDEEIRRNPGLVRGFNFYGHGAYLRHECQHWRPGDFLVHARDLAEWLIGHLNPFEHTGQEGVAASPFWAGCAVRISPTSFLRSSLGRNGLRSFAPVRSFDVFHRSGTTLRVTSAQGTAPVHFNLQWPEAEHWELRVQCTTKDFKGQPLRAAVPELNTIVPAFRQVANSSGGSVVVVHGFIVSGVTYIYASVPRAHSVRALATGIDSLSSEAETGVLDSESSAPLFEITTSQLSGHPNRFLMQPSNLQGSPNLEVHWEELTCTTSPTNHWNLAFDEIVSASKRQYDIRRSGRPFSPTRGTRGRDLWRKK